MDHLTRIQNWQKQFYVLQMGHNSSLQMHSALSQSTLIVFHAKFSLFAPECGPFTRLRVEILALDFGSTGQRFELQQYHRGLRLFLLILEVSWPILQGTTSVWHMYQHTATWNAIISWDWTPKMRVLNEIYHDSSLQKGVITAIHTTIVSSLHLEPIGMDKAWQGAANTLWRYFSQVRLALDHRVHDAEFGF